MTRVVHIETWSKLLCDLSTTVSFSIIWDGYIMSVQELNELM